MTEYYQEKIDALSNFLGEKPTNANYKNNVEFTLDNENWYEVFNEEEMKDEMEERASMEYYDFLENAIPSWLHAYLDDEALYKDMLADATKEIPVEYDKFKYNGTNFYIR